MDLKDYLKEKLSINEEKAKEIVEVLEEYKTKYGHHRHHHDEETSEDKDIFGMVKETKEYCQQNNFKLSNIHCNGCHNECPLDAPKCGRGMMLQKEFANLAK